MAARRELPDLLGRTHEVRGEEIVFRFSNGLTIKTEMLDKRDRLRILPLGSPQGGLMNHLLSFPEKVEGKRVFEPFAGSGALGLMALKAGAEHVDLLDINPRAADFQRENAGASRIPDARFTSITADIREFSPQRKYDLLLANPPFVPTPDEIDGTLTSNGGPEGSRFVEILLQRLDDFLEPRGAALIYVFQIARDGVPLIVESLGVVDHRPVELTLAQAKPIPFETYAKAYRRLFPDQGAAIERWQAASARRHGGSLTLCHFVIEIGPRSDAPTEWLIRENFAEKFGRSFLVPSEDPDALAVGRVFENVVRASSSTGAPDR